MTGVRPELRVRREGGGGEGGRTPPVLVSPSLSLYRLTGRSRARPHNAPSIASRFHAPFDSLEARSLRDGGGGDVTGSLIGRLRSGCVPRRS